MCAVIHVQLSERERCEMYGAKVSHYQFVVP